jgi:hypothetical protein
MANRLRRKLFQPECTDEGVVMIPFGFTINGTTTPDGLKGDSLSTVARSEAGEFLCTLTGEPVDCFGGFAQVSNTSDDVDMYCTVGTFVVRTMTGATQTDPTDNLLVGGVLFVKKTSRVGRR